MLTALLQLGKHAPQEDSVGAMLAEPQRSVGRCEKGLAGAPSFARRGGKRGVSAETHPQAFILSGAVRVLAFPTASRWARGGVEGSAVAFCL